LHNVLISNYRLRKDVGKKNIFEKKIIFSP